MTLPSEVYTRSPRPFPARLPQIDYPAHFEVRRVSRNSGFCWKSKWVSAGHVLVDEYVGLEEIDNGIWEVYFGPIWLGRLDEKVMKIEDKYGRFERQIRKPKV
jgi:putative transposase